MWSLRPRPQPCSEPYAFHWELTTSSPDGAVTWRGRPARCEQLALGGLPQEAEQGAISLDVALNAMLFLCGAHSSPRAARRLSCGM